jgi:hypothetical protein
MEDLSSRVLELNGRFARQKVSVKLEHYWELEYVRTRFTEFKRRVEDLENAEDGLTRWRRCWPRFPEWRWSRTSKVGWESGPATQALRIAEVR